MYGKLFLNANATNFKGEEDTVYDLFLSRNYYISGSTTNAQTNVQSYQS